MTHSKHLSEVVGAEQRGAFYDLPDAQATAGSTLGGPKCVCIIKAAGAIEKIYSSDYGNAPGHSCHIIGTRRQGFP